jgi:hypothetical protein
MQQINALLDAAQMDGADATEIATMREYLIDRAAQMDGATRLDAALSQLPDNELEAAEAFMSESAAIRGDIMTRGADTVSAISDDEWEGLTGENTR